MKNIILSLLVLNLTIMIGNAQELQTDVFQTDKAELKIQFVQHGSIFFEYNGKVIHVDPVSRMGDYNNYPKADLILITHHHGDHLDQNAIELLKKDNTKIVLTQKCKEMSEYLTDVIVMQNGDILNINELEIAAVPAYNIKHKRENGVPYHIKGEGNGYVIQFNNKKVYVAGDTENIPEMKALENIDIAFLPMNLPYTMTPEMVADAARMFKPQILYPYHYGDTDTSKLLELLIDEKDIDIRIKKM
ncbi:MAG TPA: MBL fold metallo-hydrolase [Bacteroidales bacterium]|nr:MBL fold metallo-hydrolase [Bacteroidales bacterium]